jgi:hypothetical protein
VFEPLTLLEKLAALTPRPRINLVLYHGVLAPHSSWRARVVAYGVPPAPVSVAAGTPLDEANNAPPLSAPRYWAWADLMRRALDIDVLACPRCGGCLRLVSYDHPYDLPLEHALNIDFVNEALGPGARVAVELSVEAARQLVKTIEAVLAKADERGVLEDIRIVAQ